MINGDPLAGTLGVLYNSPDIDGNGVVNLTDAQLITVDYFVGGYDFRSDLLYDSIVNNDDISIMAAAIGASCSLVGGAP